MTTANNARDALFDGKKDTNGLYKEWSNELLSTVTVSDRSVFYDSNIAFTDGNGSIVDNETPTKTVPNLYKTLEGLNTRISDVAKTQSSVSTADANLFVTNNDDGVIVAPGNGSDTNIASAEKNVSISVGTSSGDKITIAAADITFNMGSKSYSLVDIFKMIHELDCRTAAIKTNNTRSNITHDVLAADTFTLTTNLLTEA